MRRLLLLLLIVMSLTLPATAQREERIRPDAYNVAYADDHRRQRLDVYLPTQTNDDPAPVMLMIHGGGYFSGEKELMAPLADYFRERGYAVVTPEHRLAPFNPYPAPIQDLTCALAWVHAHAADYGFDTERVTVVGESAGGNAALLLGAHDDLAVYLDECPHPVPESATWVQAVVGYYPIVDLSSCIGEIVCGGARRAMALYLDVTTYTPDLLAEGNPLTHLDAGDPPVLLIHGTADRVVPFSESALYADALEAVEVAHELVPIAGADHAFAYLLETDEGIIGAEAMARWLGALGTEG